MDKPHPAQHGRCQKASTTDTTRQLHPQRTQAFHAVMAAGTATGRKTVPSRTHSTACPQMDAHHWTRAHIHHIPRYDKPLGLMHPGHRPHSPQSGACPRARAADGICARARAGASVGAWPWRRLPTAHGFPHARLEAAPSRPQHAVAFLSGAATTASPSHAITHQHSPLSAAGQEP